MVVAVREIPNDGLANQFSEQAQKLHRRRIVLEESLDRCVQSGERAQLLVVVRVLEEPDVEQQICLRGRTVLVSERYDVDLLQLHAMASMPGGRANPASHARIAPRSALQSSTLRRFYRW